MDRKDRMRKWIIVFTLIIVFLVIGVYLLYAKSGLVLTTFLVKNVKCGII